MLLQPRYKPGTIVRFTYLKSQHDRYKEVMVLVASWKGFMHAIDLRRLTEAERHVLSTIMDPKSHGKRHGIPLIDDILRRMNPSELIKEPVAFYNQFVKQFLRNKDAYRKYNPMFMTGVTVVKSSEVVGTRINARPLFRRIQGPGPMSKTTKTVKPKGTV